MKQSATFSTIIAIAAVFIKASVWGWDNEVTHTDLTGFASEQSVLDTAMGDSLRIIGLEVPMACKWLLCRTTTSM